MRARLHQIARGIRKARRRIRRLTHRRGVLLEHRAILEGLADAGNAKPELTFNEARRAGIPVALAAALDEQETGGGHMVWGHDPVNCGPVGGNVTPANYRAYKARRSRCGMQGAGDDQLTYYTIQDEADRLGGTWVSKINKRVAYHHLEAAIKAYGLEGGLSSYNAGSPDSSIGRAYARSVLAHRGAIEAKINHRRKALRRHHR